MAEFARKDGKLAWIVLIIATFSLFEEVAVLKAFSVLLHDMKEQLSSETWIIGSCISILSGLGCVFGLSANFLVMRFGERISLMISGILSGAGLAICGSATSVNMVLVGIILSSLMILPINVAAGMISLCFEKYYNIAIYIYGLGFGVAVTFVPPITQLLLNLYGWRGTILLMCGLHLQSLPLAALLNIQEHDKPKHVKETISASTYNDNQTCKGQKQSFFESIARSMDASLLANSYFILRVLIPSVSLGLVLSSWGIYMVSFVMSNGGSLQQAAFISTLGGIGMTFANIILPLLNAKFTYIQLMHVSSLMMCAVFLLSIIFNGFVELGLLSFIFGVGFTFLSTQSYIATRDVTTDEQHINAISWKHLFYGFAVLTGGPLTGLVFDYLGGISATFIVLSASSLLTSVSLAIDYIWIWLIERHSDTK